MKRIATPTICNFSSVEEIIDDLKKYSSKSYKNNVSKQGIQNVNALGVPIPIIRKLAKQVGRQHELALKLWYVGYHEGQLLATLVVQPEKMTDQLIEDWLSSVISWDLCDHLCNNLFRHLPICIEKISQWASDEREFFRRAAFSLIANLAVHQREITEEQINLYLCLSKNHAGDPRNYVKKAISWALRELGKRDLQTRQKAITLATELCKDSSPAGRWVGKDVLKELETVVKIDKRSRLISSETKMGSRVKI
ncbi:MAG: DNA alkylation repair protein [Microcystis sp. M54BS1]|nr:MULTISPECIES: DNA alkylation repair protein [unclassified Microcystis]MCA2521455.1 DNA alkylation repair protein [Microcystis sp. M63BS1]MCA2534436.1 DNA alkylation repair protein [Microcystis sp. M57BS1]MCA2538915.1 DNA alkylation repair protein [Microcystis sp. M54BS1]MCA2564934.1 DNA alkylation repair protein [Microcystis sp. M40BS1]MCA2584265.1 DNA alkylation repair protein [Microcystis sp. M39BS1]MCA2615734.1 DNA alkylation repair protein [Microcystis sp. M25BS1]NCR76457.1 DNA alkyla